MGRESDYSQAVIGVYITVLHSTLNATRTRAIKVVEEVVMSQGWAEISDEDRSGRPLDQRELKRFSFLKTSRLGTKNVFICKQGT